MKQKISLTIDKDVMIRFREYCKDNGMKLSPRIELLIKKDLENPTLEQ